MAGEDLESSLLEGRVTWVELCVSKRVHVLFCCNPFHFAMFLPELWDPEPQLAGRGCSMTASYTGKAHSLQPNVLWGFQEDACEARFISGRKERFQSKGEDWEEERSKRERGKVKEKDRKGMNQGTVCS